MWTQSTSVTDRRTDRRTDRQTDRQTDRITITKTVYYKWFRIFFGSGSDKSGIRPFSEIRPSSALAKLLAGIARLPVQLQYVQLTMDETNTAGLSSYVLVPSQAER